MTTLTFDELWELLTTQDESQQLEVKKGSEVGKSCWDTISAFSNEPGLGGGYLLLGIKASEDSASGKYEIDGVKAIDSVQRDLVSICNTTFNVPLRPQIFLETRDSKTVIIVYIPEVTPSEKPIYAVSRGLPKGAFRRIGSADVRCTDQDLELFYQERQSQSYDTIPIADATIDDLDPQAITVYRQDRAKINPNAAELDLSDQNLLHALQAIIRHPKVPDAYCPTVAGLILFGKASALRRYFPMHRIDYIVSSGNEWVPNPDERYQAVTEFREPLLLAIPRIIALIINDLPKAFRLEDNEVQRQDIPLIPSKVIREAIPNAVMHRNYRTASPIQIIRYTNRLEIRNPGYSLKPVDEIDQPGSRARNVTIAAVLHDLNIAETKGTGGRIMLETMRDANLTVPRFDSQREKDHFCLTLWTHHLLGEEDLQWLRQFRDYGLAEDEAKALVILRQAGAIDNFMYRIANAVDTLTASRKLIRLREIGLLESNGKGRATYYTLAAKYSLFGELTVEKLETSTKPGELPGELTVEKLETSTKPGELPGELTAEKLETSTKPGELPGELTAEKLETSTFKSVQLELGFPSDAISPVLQQRIQSLQGRNEPAEVRKLIIELCKLKPHSSNELSEVLKRNRNHLLEQYLKPLVKDGLLQYTNPGSPNDPQQRYTVP
jgi:ATP-dependent DNA helicase RecG